MNVLKMLGKPFTALAGKVNSSVEQKIVMSLARHGASALAGVLIAHHVLSTAQSGQFTDVVAGAALGLVAVFSGGKQKADERLVLRE